MSVQVGFFQGFLNYGADSAVPIFSGSLFQSVGAKKNTIPLVFSVWTSVLLAAVQ